MSEKCGISDASYTDGKPFVKFENTVSIENAEFLQVVENSQYFTNLEQIIRYVEQKKIDDYLLIGLKNSLSRGYELKLKDMK